ncbi:MAG TPA: HAMP domain-containing sensor histidine kinase [Actinocrinis sp.]|uniref:sensor histidine kinase n=1 Tax=Actinocrinis sp. TaxID=1920516 RepID=UPI002DDD2198|nr:HAMP domain-containing sensor histidine kinase [Actinocrinis sp.]HEV3171294.1 HAMP domain-containing sensor histidine kinase [Actinocrinis sp.]
MSRRIALAFTALIAALLVLAVVPLGVSMTNNERTSFRYGTQSSANQVASSAEEYLADHHGTTAMYAALAAASARGDCAAVFGSDGVVVASTPCGAATEATARRLVTQALAARSDTAAQDGAWLRVAVPISDADKTAGAVLLARSADPVNDRISVMWGWLILIGVGCLLVGVVLSVWLARWVARPLGTLGQAAARLGDGTLDVRAPVDSGPAEVRALALTFNRMAERTRMLVDAHQVWVADVSHQLRTPLTALRLRLDLLADDVDDEAAAELAGAQEEIARLSRLVDGLLAVARAESSVPQPQPVRADAVAAERVAAWEPVARERRIGLTADPGEQATAYLGPGDLAQMLDNVLANALEAVPDGGRVRIEVANGAGRVSLRVVDDGPGMSEQAKQAAFRRFGNPAARGNGLGLAIVYRLATANGGAVNLSDTPGGGLTVELDLPAERRKGAGRDESGA